jgi:hypothetical protein
VSLGIKITEGNEKGRQREKKIKVTWDRKEKRGE